MSSPDAVVIGAGPAGLAVAARLHGCGLTSVILEKAATVGSVWRRHYDRLHLHTPRIHSSLPGLPIPAAYGRYPSREQFVAYLESYARTFALEPVFGTTVSAVRREANGWRAEAGAASITAPVVVVATGWADFPYTPTYRGMDGFGGPLIHSSLYRNSATFAGKRVLVVGFGNSGGEIALDLAEAGIAVTLAVRSPVRIIPRDLLGVPIVSWAIAQQYLPARVVDFINAPVLRLATGSIEKLGLKRAAKGPMRMIEEDGRIPLLDIGTVAKIRAGAIQVRGAIERFTANGVVFSDGSAREYDAVILATGFRPDLRALLPDAVGVLDASGKPLVSDATTAEPGLYVCGAIPVATGQLRQIGIGAKRIADLAKRFLQDGRTRRAVGNADA